MERRVDLVALDFRPRNARLGLRPSEKSDLDTGAHTPTTPHPRTTTPHIAPSGAHPRHHEWRYPWTINTPSQVGDAGI